MVTAISARRAAVPRRLTARVCRQKPRIGQSTSPRRFAKACLPPRAKASCLPSPARTGQRTLLSREPRRWQYEGPEGQGSCTYNWSKLSQIDKLTDQFEAIAATLDEGSKLQRQYEHGRLSLDTELETPGPDGARWAGDRSREYCPYLAKLAGDDAVLQRVQRRARALLQAAKED